MGLFGQSNKLSPKEAVKDWNSKLRKESLVLDRQIRNIQREEEKVKRQIKDAAKKGHKEVLGILAKEVMNSRKAVNKIHSAKAQINSVQLSIKQQQATLRISGALEKSTAVMKSMQSLIKLPEVSATMREMSREMMKMGMIEEMIEDTMESVEPSEDLNEDVQVAVDRILDEVLSGNMVNAPDALKDTIQAGPSEEAEGDAAISDDEEDVSNMRHRLEALRS